MDLSLESPLLPTSLLLGLANLTKDSLFIWVSPILVPTLEALGFIVFASNLLVMSFSTIYFLILEPTTQFSFWVETSVYSPLSERIPSSTSLCETLTLTRLAPPVMPQVFGPYTSPLFENCPFSFRLEDPLTSPPSLSA